MKIKIKRVYEKPDKEDGIRILVDGLWPRALTKGKASFDLWLKDIAPSAELRKWFDHNPAKWNEFRQRYSKELKREKGPISLLKAQVARGVVTMVYAARDQEHNEAFVLKELVNLKQT
jgi:uncharacterized protein YeaO (DUF488 family)